MNKPTKVEPREHISIYKDGHEDWRAGFTCDECELHRLGVLAQYPRAGREALLYPVSFGGAEGSINPNVEEFWATGEPEVLKRKRSE